MSTTGLGSHVIHTHACTHACMHACMPALTFVLIAIFKVAYH